MRRRTRKGAAHGRLVTTGQTEQRHPPAQGVGSASQGYRRGVTDLNPRVQQQAQETIQQIADEVANEHSGQDPELVRTALAERIAAAGLPEQPEKWVADTADEIAGGRRLVVDRALRDDDDPDRSSPSQG
jgi:hypothetical protein